MVTRYPTTTPRQNDSTTTQTTKCYVEERNLLLYSSKLKPKAHVPKKNAARGYSAKTRDGAYSTDPSRKGHNFSWVNTTRRTYVFFALLRVFRVLVCNRVLESPIGLNNRQPVQTNCQESTQPRHNISLPLSVFRIKQPSADPQKAPELGMNHPKLLLIL